MSKPVATIEGTENEFEVRCEREHLAKLREDMEEFGKVYADLYAVTWGKGYPQGILEPNAWGYWVKGPSQTEVRKCLEICGFEVDQG